VPIKPVKAKMKGTQNYPQYPADKP